MISRIPDCVAYLEDRLQSNATYWRNTVRGRRLWFVEVNAHKGIYGYGETLEAAVDNIITKI